MNKCTIFRRSTGPMAAFAVVAALASPASAATDTSAAVVRVHGLLTYTAAAGQANQLDVTVRPVKNEHAYRYTLDDVYEIRVLGDECTHPKASDLTKVVCKVTYTDADTEPSFTAKFHLGDENDTVAYHNPDDYGVANQFWLGSGDDKAVTRQPGGRTDDSAVYGQGGNDTIVAGAGDDLSLVLGGNGDDTISVYGPGDASGGPGDDRILGYDGKQTFYGGDGNDLIDGGDGDDLLVGGRGNDRLWGRPGNDVLYGNSGDDELHGGLGKDRMLGGPGKNVIRQR